MPTDAVFSLGGVRIGFSGRVPPLSDGSFLPQFRAEGAPDVTLELYQDADVALDAPVIYEDSFYASTAAANAFSPRSARTGHSPHGAILSCTATSAGRVCKFSLRPAPVRSIRCYPG